MHPPHMTNPNEAVGEVPLSTLGLDTIVSSKQFQEQSSGHVGRRQKCRYRVAFESFVGDHVECGPERKEHGERWCGRSHPLIRPLLRLAHVPEEPRISGSLVRI